MIWLTTPPPKDDNLFIADIGLPWPVMCLWNKHEEKWVYPNLQVNMIDGEYTDPYFENEYEPETGENMGIRKWMPLPDTKNNYIAD